MSDDNTTAPAGAAVGASALLSSSEAPPAPSVSVQQAYERLGQMRADSRFQELLVRGDAAALHELKTLTALTRLPTGIQVNVKPDQTPEARENVADTWASRADLPPEVLQQVRERRPVSAEEYKRAVQMKKQLHSDKAWVSRFLAGDREAGRQSALISIILGSQIKESSNA